MGSGLLGCLSTEITGDHIVSIFLNFIYQYFILVIKITYKWLKINLGTIKTKSNMSESTIAGTIPYLSPEVKCILIKYNS